ncbi:bestrophin-like domain [Ancylobacter amanitiformis]|uniref:DUF4239 domain-containing protein n=1 Tax=Ancylobacter amanitiformis TaxID=217069 RepID=A0ABU0LQ82_9HYPH|nr:hypothetical protein [Ancylobacter amanitiformis]MDQ0510851.1 hypothetical protein [Ancylobacter amanitiformis]
MSWSRIITGDFFSVFVVLIGIIPLLTGWLCYWAAMRPRAVAVFHPKDLQTSYLGALTLPFALFLAFMVTDIWGRETRYAQTVLQEVQKLDAMLDIARVCGPTCAPVDEAVNVYARALSKYEWDEGWVYPETQVSKAFDGLIASIAAAEADTSVASHMRSALLSGQIDLRRLRTDRYFILHTDLAPHRWIIVLILGVLSQVGLAALHVGKRPQLVLGMVTFSLAFAVTLAYTVALAWPTVDESIIPSEELRRILE